ncbi:S66 peptidase family protein [Streptoalloteichus tenebrarius]|uniref:S66 peptidase family protein n=1 Tax=Streptoalloteichus tenebrarius (strain ATCC 17920 / DSM 40477 / JCM 4838 / CBS 697.72 / NBRC 16177 / NCIMB 11028 / NRRL B-12390 / A12253. 1 / ISP 5477) TaxID=1933 RepID=UPI0020A33653|nr:LD-carboxypeptidase [Streptoalloteichus tenebrarius]BFE98491.1 LD-carboxypeptidase [Streptoalloteichus tenebrarius]
MDEDLTAAGRPRERPRRLRPGQRVAVVAPAGPVEPELLERGVAILRSWGLEVVLGEHVLDRHPGLDYLAGRDQDRAADLERAWCDPEVAAVFCARGGYGSQRVLDLLDWAAMRQAGPKLLVGSSDITALHGAFATRLDLVTVFGPMVATRAFAADEAAADHLRRSLFTPHETTVLRRDGAMALVSGRASGLVVGGNLSLLASGVGDPLAPPSASGALVLLEDVGEDPYRLDRMVTQLDRAGWFDGVRGIVLGSWVDCGPVEEVRSVLAERLSAHGVPVLWELGFGHCVGQLTVPLGVRAVLDADAATLTLREPALR